MSQSSLEYLRQQFEDGARDFPRIFHGVILWSERNDPPSGAWGLFPWNHPLGWYTLWENPNNEPSKRWMHGRFYSEGGYQQQLNRGVEHYKYYLQLEKSGLERFNQLGILAGNLLPGLPFFEKIPQAAQGMWLSTVYWLATVWPGPRLKTELRSSHIEHGEASEEFHGQVLVNDVYASSSAAIDVLLEFGITWPDVQDTRQSLQITTGRGRTDIAIGGTHVGDKINIGGDAIGAAVGSHASLRAHDITTYKQVVDQSLTLDEDVKRALKEAREALEKADLSEADKGDATDDLGKLTDELQKPEKDVGRVRRLWNHIKDIAPPVASILSSAASLAKMLGG